MSSKKGLGMVLQPALNVSPSPAVIDQYFTAQLKYFSDLHNLKTKEVNIPKYVTYKKVLNHPDNPEFDVLSGVQCISYIIIDIWTGCLKDSWFELHYCGQHPDYSIENYYENVKIVSYEQLTNFINKESELEKIIWMFRWHLNIVHMTREYLKGGWLERPSRINALKASKEARKYLNKFGLTNIINNARPSDTDMYYTMEDFE